MWLRQFNAPQSHANVQARLHGVSRFCAVLAACQEAKKSPGQAGTLVGGVTTCPNNRRGRPLEATRYGVRVAFRVTPEYAE